MNAPRASSKSSALALARSIAQRFASLEEVEAAVLSGSQSSRASDESSDIDLYVYTTASIALETRRRVVNGGLRAEIGNEFWEPGDEWVDGETGITVDVMYRDVDWIREQLDRVLVHHRASIGYTTCFWYNVLYSDALHDRRGWFAELQRFCRQPYPQELRRAIVAKNYPVLRSNQSSYLHQIDLALKRGDVISRHHRVTALLASYFDVIFAINDQPHPGEKRLLPYARALCRILPLEMEADIVNVVSAQNDALLHYLRKLLEGLDVCLEKQGFIP